MSKADGKCSKCNGTGFVSSPVVHLGVPGTCYQCDGAGTYEAWLAVRARNKAAKAAQARYSVVYDKVWLTKEANPNAPKIPRERYAELKNRIFSTQEYASQYGMSVQDAWKQLCATFPRACPVERPDASFGWATELP